MSQNEQVGDGNVKYDTDDFFIIIVCALYVCTYTTSLKVPHVYIVIVKLREREGQRVDSGRSLKGHL